MQVHVLYSFRKWKKESSLLCSLPSHRCNKRAKEAPLGFQSLNKEWDTLRSICLSSSPHQSYCCSCCCCLNLRLFFWNHCWRIIWGRNPLRGMNFLTPCQPDPAGRGKKPLAINYWTYPEAWRRLLPNKSIAWSQLPSYKWVIWAPR